MSFDTTAGTRGARQPHGVVFRWGNKLMTGRIRRKGGAKVLGFNALVLTTIGRKTGVERATPVAWFPGPDGSWLIVASAAGAARNPAWYHNIAAHPDQVQIEVEGRKVAVTAEQLHGPERDQAWQQITTAAPRFAQYQVKTDRELPIIRLMPRSAGQAPPESGGQAPPESGGQAPPESGGQAPPESGGQAPPESGGQAPPESGGQAPPESGGQASPESGGQVPQD